MKFTSMIRERGVGKGVIELPKDNLHWTGAICFILLAYFLSFWVRLEWIDYAQENYLDEKGNQVFMRPNMVQDGVALPNTHDSFYFGSIVQKAAFGRHQENHLIPDVYKNGMITALPYWLIKLFPSLTIEQLLLWLPVYVAGIVCIPIVLIGRLYGSTLWGFYAACLAGITHSYYNRTLAGYYDTDIFSITSPAFSVFFLLAASRKNSIGYLTAASVSLLCGNFFYGSVQAVTCSLALAFLVYRLFLLIIDWKFSDKPKSLPNVKDSNSLNFALLTILNMSWVLFAEGWSLGSSVAVNFPQFCFGLSVPVCLFLLVRFGICQRNSIEGDVAHSQISVLLSKVFTVSSILVVLLLLVGLLPFAQKGPFGNTWMKITGKLQSYSVIGKSGATTSSVKGYSFKFLDVTTTIREASEIPPEVVRNRILADTPTCSCPRCMPAGIANAKFLVPAALIGLIGAFVMMLRYWELCLAFPFLAIAYYCFKGSVGLRFTVHVGNYAALGLVFLLLCLIWGGVLLWNRSSAKSDQWLSRARYATWIFMGLLVCWFASPNLQHAANYHSHVVYPVKTMEVLNKLNEASSPEDFVVTWWDYGSGCWYYGDARTFTSPAHQTFDNFLSSEILRSTSERKAANLSRLKTEVFVDLQKSNKAKSSAFPTAVQSIFRDGQSDQVFYQGLLADAESADFKLPPKTRETFLFLPYEILRIFPTILSFSSRNLYFSGNEGSNLSNLREPPMMVLRNGRREGASYVFDGGYRLDRSGYLRVESPQSGVITYGQAFQIDESGGAASLISSVSLDGLKIALRNDPTNGRRILFLPNRGDLVIMSADTFRSGFARRFLIDGFDEQAYEHPLFAQGANPRKQPFFTQADWVTSKGSVLSLNMRGGYRIEVNLNLMQANLPGVNEPVPFSFHRKLHNEDTGELIDIPSKLSDQAKFHLIQTNTPYFVGARNYTVPKGGKSVKDIAKSSNLPVRALASSLNCSLDHVFPEGEILRIPGTGYQLGQAWFFMDQEAFDSLLVKGYFMENLNPEIFEKIYSTSWGKVYKIKSI